MKRYKVTLNYELTKLKRIGNIQVKGNVSGDVTNKNGNIVCRDVGGDASTKNGDVIHS